MKRAKQSSANAGFQQILEAFRREHFNVRNPKAEHWDGTAFELHMAIHSLPGAEVAMRRFDVDAVGRMLSSLKNKGVGHIEILEEAKDSEVRVWRIRRPGYDQVKGEAPEAREVTQSAETFSS